METPFADSQLKIERAKEHIKNFLSRMVEFGRDSGHSVLVHSKTNTGYDALEIVSTKAIPPDLMCIAGDAIHNLRSALDVAMSEIEFVTTSKRTKDVTFPVYKTRDDLEKAVNSRLEGKTPKRVIDYIVKSIQPYERGNGDSIWQLHRLDIVDKHRIIVPHLQLEWVRNIRYVDDTGEELTVPEWIITSTRRVFFPTEKRGVQVTHKGYSSVGVVFGKGMPLESKHVFPTLGQLTTFVTKTLAVLEREFAKSQGK
jgi:hypothetical protein